MPAIHKQLDIYGVWLHLARNRREYASLRRYHDMPTSSLESLGQTARTCETDGTVHLCMYLDVKRLGFGSAGFVEILTHEATHAGAMLLDHVGQEYDGESEALAYLVGFIAAWCWEGCEG
jgi:hypothetical protein